MCLRALLAGRPVKQGAMPVPPLWLWPLAGALLGLVAGSFLATLVVRWPRGETLWGRSHCDSCGRQLGWSDMLPLLSFVVARGRCRQCHAAINWRHPAIELAAALIGFAAFAVVPGPEGLAGALLGWLLLALLALDAEHLWLPDALTMPLLGAGLLLGQGAMADRLLAAAIGGGALLLIALAYRLVRHRDGLGLGDVKLMAGLGAWLGWQALPLLLLLAALLGLGLAAVRAVQGRPLAAVPLGACLAAAAFPLWLAGPALFPLVV